MQPRTKTGGKWLQPQLGVTSGSVSGMQQVLSKHWRLIRELMYWGGGLPKKQEPGTAICSSRKKMQ